MLRLTAILLSAYYLIGSLFLQKGDLSTLSTLPDMYSHCKATEDKHLTPFDFITDHLLKLDSLFEEHDDEEEVEEDEKEVPHTPVQFNHTQQQTTFITRISTITPFLVTTISAELPHHLNKFYHSDFFSFVFRPPIS